MLKTKLTPIWLISPSANKPGHYWEHTRKLARELLNTGNEVCIACYETPAKTLRFNDEDLILISPGAFTRRLLRLLIPSEHWRSSFACIILALLGGAGRKGVVTHYCDGPVPLFALMASVGLLRGVITVWGSVGEADRNSTGHRLRKSLIGYAVERQRLHLVCETQAMAEIWRQDGAGDAVSVIPYGLETVGSSINRDTAREALGIDSDARMVLLFGTHRDDKDYRTVIRAAKLLPVPPLLLFAGKCLGATSPSKLCANEGYARFLAIDEYIPRDQVPLYFRAADVTVLPYPAIIGSGVVVEACSYGCPIVASNGGHLEQFVRSNDVGEVYEAGSAESLRAALSRAFDTERQNTIRERMAAVAESHSMRRVIGAYLDIFSRFRACGRDCPPPTCGENSVLQQQPGVHK